MNLTNCVSSNGSTIGGIQSAAKWSVKVIARIIRTTLTNRPSNETLLQFFATLNKQVVCVGLKIGFSLEHSLKIPIIIMIVIMGDWFWIIIIKPTGTSQFLLINRRRILPTLLDFLKHNNQFGIRNIFAASYWFRRPNRLIICKPRVDRTSRLL